MNNSANKDNIQVTDEVLLHITKAINLIAEEITRKPNKTQSHTNTKVLTKSHS
jgi:hypothetical protein